MKLLRYVILVCAAIICGTTFAQSQRELGQLMRNRGEYYFTLSVNNPNEIQAISNICSVDGTDGRTVVAYANQQEYDKLLQAGYQPYLQTPPSLLEEAVMWEGGDRATYDWNSYLSYGDYVSMMEGFTTLVTNGANCTLLDLGTLSTTNHRRILGVRLNNGQPNGKPKFLYTSTMHGDEVTGMILMLRLIDEFCTSTDTRITNILNNVDLFIFPCTNPDGTYYGGNNSVSGARRANGNNIDLNRHFPDFDDGAHPDGASYYQDETQWMMNLAQQYLFTMGANYHGGAEIVNYPWDTYQPLHPDDAWWQYVSREYAQLCQAVSSSYMTTADSSGDTPSGITNGYAWYTITGSRQDYMNYYGQCRELTIECSKAKTPTASQLPNFWNYNHNAMLAYIEQCLNGVHGFVYDAVTGEPIEGVSVTVLSHDALGSSVSTHVVGDFHRPIKGGTYTFEFSKSGYYPQSVEVVVTDGQRVDLEPVYLEYGAPIPEDPDIVIMQNGSVETCNALFYDSGGENGNYGNNLEYIMTINPSSDGAMVSVSFSQFNVESNYDYLYIYDGTSTSATLIGQYSGTTSPGTVTATNADGALTFRFTSDNYVNKIGWVAAVSCVYPDHNITVTAIPEEGGSITGAGTFGHGETCTLTATPNAGYYFVNWTENDIEVSSEATYSFAVTGDRDLVANFSQEEPTTVTQISEFGAGWNWWTPNTEVTLEQLEAALGSNGILIIDQSGASITYHPVYGWGGETILIEMGKMYKIEVSTACTITLEGAAPASHSVTLCHGENWIGFFGSQSMSVNDALMNLSATQDDIITSQDGKSATYNSTYGWGGDLNILVPGQAYLYTSRSSENQTFTYPSTK